MSETYINTRFGFGQFPEDGIAYKPTKIGNQNSVVQTTVYVQDTDETIAVIDYELKSLADLREEVHTDLNLDFSLGRSQRMIVKVTNLQLCDNKEHLKKFMKHIFTIFLNSVTVSKTFREEADEWGWGIVCIPLSKENYRLVVELSDSVEDCSFRIGNRYGNITWLLYH